MTEPNNILPTDSEKDKQLSEATLMRYLEGKLSPAEQHEVEQWLATDGMESDALEGLHSLKPEETRHSVSRLNHQLRTTILSKKRKRRKLKTDYNTIIAIAVILLLAIIAYIVIRKSV